MSAISAYAQVLEAWFECRACFPDFLRLLLRMFSTTPNDIGEAITSWKALAKQYDLKANDMTTPVQVLNPAMGKGINRAKADGAGRLDNPDSFWLLEFLKFWGLWSAGVPRVRSGHPVWRQRAARSQNLCVASVQHHVEHARSCLSRIQ